MPGQNCRCSYHEKELQVQACDWPHRDDKEVHAGLGTLRNRKLKQEGKDSQEICVDVVQREFHKHSAAPTTKHTKVITQDMSLPLLVAGTSFHI